MEFRGNPPVVKMDTTGRLSIPWRHRFTYRLVPDSVVVFEEADGRMATRPATDKRALLEAHLVHSQWGWRVIGPAAYTSILLDEPRTMSIRSSRSRAGLGSLALQDASE